jgi:glyoxylase-like metal-dependent hydrolase (beta-lactamase superfamily II)
MQLIFEPIRTGGDRNFGYLLGDRDAGVCVLIDPSYTPEALVERASAQNVRVTHVINTHGHPDHVNGNARAVELTGAAVAAQPDCPVAASVPLRDGSRLDVGTLRLDFLHVPGHCPDHLVVHESKHGLVMTGDLIFVGKVGGTSNDEDARTEWASLRRVLDAYADHTTVWPGHDYGARPSSTLALERASNPFLRCADVAEFLQLKRDWPALKKQHGLR